MHDVGAAPTFGVLGALEVRHDGVPAPLPGGNRRALLAALLVRANRPVPADVLIEAGWGDSLPADPRAALHTALSRLRAVLGEDVLRSEPGGYVLGTEDLDAARFETLCAEAVEVPPARAAALLDEALGLWRGPAYAEFADREFAGAEAVRLDELRSSTVEDRAALSLASGRPAEAIPALESLLTEHPLRERACALLMTALYRAGRPADALARYRDHRALLADELGLDPSPALQDLEVRILGHDLPAATSPVPGHRSPAAWPVAGTAFVGRDDEAARLVDAVERHHLVTITGTGGVGKTRLLAEALPALGDRLGLPATVVELAAVPAGRVDTAVAAAVGVTARADTAHDALLEYLGVVATLLVLDNCEHVLDECHTFAAAVRRRCPGVRIVATSRHRLGPGHEQVFPLDPLPAPDPRTAPERTELTAASRLFADRARRVRPAFALTPDAATTVAQICHRLDGLPLALELAATRAATLGLAPVQERLGSGLDLLDAGGGGRHGSLRAVIEWSYDLLGPEQRRLLAALSVFTGAFDLDAAEQVADRTGTEAVADRLARLVEASLVSTHDVTGHARYRLLEVVRAFAHERLRAAGEEHEARVRHLRWVHRLAAAAADAATGPGGAAALTRLERNRANLTAALQWALRSDGAELAGRVTGSLALCLHWCPDADLYDLMRDVAAAPAVRQSGHAATAIGAAAFAAVEQGDLDVGEDLADQALRHAHDPVDRYLPMLAHGIATLYSGRMDRSRAWWDAILAIEDLPAAYRADTHATLALLAGYRGDLPAAREHATRARTGAEVPGADNTRAFATYATGETLLLTDTAAAVPVLREAAALANRSGAAQVSAVARIALLSALVRLDRHAEALDLATPLLHDELRTGSWPQIWTTIRILAELLVALDRAETAALLLAGTRAAPAAPALKGHDLARYRALDTRIARRLGPGVLEQVTTLARTLPRARVVDIATTTVGELASTTPGQRSRST